MKSKKKIGFVKRIAVGVCALVVAVSCVGSSEAYYAYSYEAHYDFSEYSDFCLEHSSPIYDSLPNDVLENNLYWCIVTSQLTATSDCYVYLYCSSEPIEVTYYHNGVDDGAIEGCYIACDTVDSRLFSLQTNGIWKEKVYTSEAVIERVNYSSSIGYLYKRFQKFWYANHDIYTNGIYDSSLYFSSTHNFDGTLKPEEVYNSSLGYLQDIKRQFIYLEDDDWSIVEDTAACKFTFANTSTSGLDITDGNWSIRHYMQIEVKNAKQEYETVEVYDKVYMDEYAAADGKIIYQQKDTVQCLHEESGFDGLSWWESNFLGYITYYNDYFQLVRTNEDGSVEYGGYVKVWQDEYNINHSTTLGEDGSQDSSGYNDNIVSGSHGSGGTYEEAEKDADENAANSSTSNDEALVELDNILSTIIAVPEAFRRMFSFLPDWCLNSIGIAIVAGVAIIVWKTGRG